MDYREGPSRGIDAPTVERVGAVVLPEAKVASVHIGAGYLGDFRRWYWQLPSRHVGMLTGRMKGMCEI